MAVDDFARWPETLPQRFLEESYSEAPPQLVEFSDKIYPPIARQKRLNGPWQVSGELKMNLVQYARFREFWRDTLRGGLYKFRANLDDTDAVWQIQGFDARPSNGVQMRVTMKCFRYDN